MDNAQKAIMIGVGLFITIIIISIVLLITNLGTGMAEEATDNIGNMSEALQNTLKSSYDQMTVKGSDVQNLYTQYKDDDSFVLVIEAKDGKYYAKEYYYITNQTTYYRYRYINSSSQTGETYYYPTKWSSGFTNKINASDTYKTYLIKKDDTVVGVYCDKI